MKKLILISFVVFICCSCATLNDNFYQTALKEKLYLKSKTKRKRCRLKIDEFVKLTLHNDTLSMKGIIRLYNSNGLFISPFTLSTDTLVVNTKYNYYIQDSIIFIDFDSIKQIDYRKNVSRKLDANILLATFAYNGILGFTALGIGVEWNKTTLIGVSSSSILLAYSIWLQKRLFKKPKEFKTEEYQFILK